MEKQDFNSLTAKLRKYLKRNIVRVRKKMRKNVFLGFMSMGALVTVISLPILLFFALTMTFTRELMIIQIQDNHFSDIQVGFQRTNVKGALFDNTPKGNLRLYIEVQSKNNSEVVYTYLDEKVGNGKLTISDIKFPNTNDEWLMKFELKTQDLQKIDSKCYLARFKVENGSKQIERVEVPAPC